MQWLEVTVNTCHKRLEAVSAQLESLGISGLLQEDEQEIAEFLENNKKYWDYVDEEYMKSLDGICCVKFYLEDSKDGLAEYARIKNIMAGEEFSCKKVKDEDWENNWKQYYKPILIGDKLLIVPEWEAAPQTGDHIILRLDPGLIFGTGGHATTKMCLEALCETPLAGMKALDLGCGSGILAIAALLLGADKAVGCDIDEKAPSVVMENAALNGIRGEKLSVFAGDVLSDSELSTRLSGEKFQVVVMNIVADVIISLSPKVKDFMDIGGIFICSGIIDGREAEVAAALKRASLNIREHRRKDGWNAFICD